MTKAQRKSIEEKLANCDDQSPEFQAWAREELERNARRYNIDNGIVGYQSPPKKHQFKKGHKCGPGRPKGTALYVHMLEALLKRNRKAIDQIVDNLVAGALSGDIKSIKAILYIESRKRIR